MVTILQSNLITALHTVIKEQRAFERAHLGYTMDSGLVAGWQQVLTAAQRGEEIVVVRHD